MAEILTGEHKYRAILSLCLVNVVFWSIDVWMFSQQVSVTFIIIRSQTTKYLCYYTLLHLC